MAFRLLCIISYSPRLKDLRESTRNLYCRIQETPPSSKKFRKLCGNITEDMAWKFLGEVLPAEFGHEEVKSGKQVLLIMIDEVPGDSEEIHCLGRLRDSLRVLKNVCVLLCGTHSKAANMVGLTNGDASREDNEAPVAWAYIITRLPRFDLEGSGLGLLWASLSSREGSKYICRAIQTSISHGGNPWLISLAIQVTEGMDMSDDLTEAFRVWQENLSAAVVKCKFSGRRISHQFKGLMGQLNLLLDASSTSNLSDILLGHHFAYRGIPDYGESTDKTDKRATLNRQTSHRQTTFYRQTSHLKRLRWLPLFGTCRIPLVGKCARFLSREPWTGKR
jgi:hypothetical protein